MSQPHDAETSGSPEQLSMVTALVYYIPAAGSVELYIPELRTCVPYDILHGPMPSCRELRDQAQESVGGRGQAQLAFRPPHDNELTDPPDSNSLVGAPGYGVPGFGHIHFGCVRTDEPRPPGAAPVPCPPDWFGQ